MRLVHWVWNRINGKPRPTPFMQEMRTARAEALAQRQASLRAQKRDRERRLVLREAWPLETGIFDDHRRDPR